MAEPREWRREDRQRQRQQGERQEEDERRDGEREEGEHQDAQPAAIKSSANGTVTKNPPIGGMSSMPLSAGSSVHQNICHMTQPMP